MEARHPLAAVADGLTGIRRCTTVAAVADAALARRAGVRAALADPDRQSGQLGDDWKITPYGVAVIPGDYAR